MKAKNLIKSSQRVKEVGEVFTPIQIVRKMLNQPEVKAKVNDLSATFLEPSAGEGIFLVEILRRKMRVARKRSATVEEFADNCLIALSSLYGIELMGDNEERLVMNMIVAFSDCFREKAKELPGEVDGPRLIKSAETIISANMVQGNALTSRDSNDRPIVFSAWRLLPQKGDGQAYTRRRVQRVESFLNSDIKVPVAENRPLFSGDSGIDDQYIHRYAPCRLIDVYKQEPLDGSSAEEQTD